MKGGLSLEQGIAKAFIVCLPFRMLTILTPIKSVMGAQAEYFSLIFHALGLLLCLSAPRMLFGDGRRGPGALINAFWKMVAVFAAISFVMALYVNSTFGRFNGNSPYVAVLKMLLDFVQYGLIMMYTKAAFGYIGRDSVFKCLLLSTRITLVVGYLQIAALAGIPIITDVYKTLAKFFAFNTFRRQIALTFWEPSWAAMFIGIVVIPVHAARLITRSDSPAAIAAEFVAWIPVIIFTKSTTAYLLTFASLGTAILFILFGRTRNFGVRLIAVLLMGAGIFMLNNLEYVDSVLGFNFSYLLRTKVLDMQNQSTASRMIPIIGNWAIFLKFPIIGCGNGLQGYYFKSLIGGIASNYRALDKPVKALLSGTLPTIANGQLFFPAILSGYGLVGAALMVSFFAKCLKCVRERAESYGIFGQIYLLALVPVFIAGFKSEFVGIYYLWFILSLPYSAYDAELDC